MASTPLYPWYVKSHIYSLRGFDRKWFEQIGDERPRKSIKFTSQFIPNSDDTKGHWQGNAYFEIFARNSIAETLAAREESYWSALPNVEPHKRVHENSVIAKTVESAPLHSPPYTLKYEIAYSLLMAGGKVPSEWEIDESQFSKYDNAIPILDVWQF
jgi:hypothetical protein